MHFYNNLQRNFSIPPPFLQEIASKFRLKIVPVGELYQLQDTTNIENSYPVLSTLDELKNLLLDLAKVKKFLKED